jgi:neutral ceramidase
MRPFAILVVCALAGCGDDAPPATGVTLERCTYEPLRPTAGAGGTVTAGALQAGAADRVLHIPVGTALGGYTARAGFLGSAGVVDARKVKISGSFNPSIGVETAPRVKAVALTAGGETVLVLHFDAIFVYEGMVFDLEQRLGPEYAGKVIISASHSHSAWAQFTAHAPLKLGSGELRELVYGRFLADFEAAAREALAARRPAKLGVFFDANFDPMNMINHDRRGDNDMLPGGNRKDNQFFLIRIDGTDDVPIAAMPIFGEHGVLNDDDNPLASTDATGALERVFQEQFDSKVVVMHLQSAGGDVSPNGHGGLDCALKPGASGDPCFLWVKEEGHGRAAASTMMAAWTAAGANMKDSLELEMVTRSIETGPNPYPKAFSIRDGALAYGSMDGTTVPDGIIYDNAGAIASPVDEYNAPIGAALCETKQAMFPAAQIAGTEGLVPYGSCIRLDIGGEIIGEIFNFDFSTIDDRHPVCETTRTTVSALRIGDYVVATMPGELTVMLAEYMRSKSPVAPDKTILLGYAQGHVGYLLRPEDWLMGGYEPSVTFWGPLEGEHIADKALELLPLVLTPMREDAAAGAANRVAVPAMTNGFEIDDPAPNRGTVPATIPGGVWSRMGQPTQAQPDAQIARVSGVARFVWIGDDPNVQTPYVKLQMDVGGNWVDLKRRSGRLVDDGEVVLAYTPNPLQRMGPQTHYWVAEWQAVPWVGQIGVDGLSDRGGVALGRYRFHVEGKGWALDSQPFDVVAGGVTVMATRMGGNIRTTVRYHAPKGWRLMDMLLMSNQPVPLRSQVVNVEVRNGSTVLNTMSLTTDPNGVVTVPDNAAANNVQVSDRFGNTANVAL